MPWLWRRLVADLKESLAELNSGGPYKVIDTHMYNFTIDVDTTRYVCSMYVSVCLCVCMCVRDREREREREYKV